MNNFTVLLSIYNKEKPHYLNECFFSLFKQSLAANEIIVVFDGTLSDKLVSIVNCWAKTLPIKIVYLKENVGLGKALNEGLKYCSNEWVFRMDTDDICLPERFEKQVAFIRNNPDVVLFSTQVEEFDKTMSNSLGIKKVPISNQEIYRFALLRNPFNHMSVAYKKSVIEQVGGYQHHLYMEDYNLWLRVIAKRYQVYNLPEVLVNVRSGSEMYGRRKGLEYIKSEYKLARLKIDLKLQSSSMSIFYFILRSLPRVFSKSLLGKIYQKLRKG